MKIEVEMSIETLRDEIENLRAFKNRWIEILTGYSYIEPGEDNEKTCALLHVENTMEYLLDLLENAETKQQKIF